MIAAADDRPDDGEDLAALAELAPDRCWACRAGLPHQHGDGQDCAHVFADGDRRTCCADHDADRVGLLVLAHHIRTGTASVPDDLAGLAGPEPSGGAA